MGLVRAVGDAIGTVFADQWREYFYCDSISNDILVVKGQRKTAAGRTSNNKGLDNIISNGSVIAVNEGQCMIIVEQGDVIEFCADAGEFVYDTSTEPSMLYGNLGEGLKNTFANIGRRFTFAGEAAKDQRIYFFNTKEILDNKFGTANPIPFRIEAKDIGLVFDTSLRCNGTYSFKLADPLLFYKNVCGNVTGDYKSGMLTTQMRAELVMALQPALAKLSAKGISYSEIPAYAEEIAGYLNEELSEKWGESRGIGLVSITLNAPTIPQSDLDRLNDLQFASVYRNPGMGAAAMVDAQTRSMVIGAEALKEAAGNTATGSVLAFAGLNMANQASQANMMNAGGTMAVNAGQLYQAALQANGAGAVNETNTSNEAPALGWNCSCGQKNNRGKFCSNCGTPKPAGTGWTCGCGTDNQGKFCVECGRKKPDGT